MTTPQQEIAALVKKRKDLFKTTPKSKRINTMANQIMEKIDAHFNELEVDFILQTLTHLGHAPAVVFDDNGLWAVSGTGMNQVVTGRQRIEGAMHIIVEKKYWHTTIRKALKYYLKEE